MPFFGLRQPRRLCFFDVEPFTASLVYSLDAGKSAFAISLFHGEHAMKHALLASLAIFALSLSLAAQSPSEKPATQQPQAPPQPAANASAKPASPRPHDVKSIDIILVALDGAIPAPAEHRHLNAFR